MKRYFISTDGNFTAEFEITEGSSAMTASAEEYSKKLGFEVEEISKEEYKTRVNGGVIL